MDEALLRDLADEELVLDRLVAACDAADWARATPAVGWTVADTIAHLAVAEQAAAASLLHDRDPLAGFATVPAAHPATEPATDRTEAPTAGPATLLAGWRTTRATVLEAFAARADDDRVPWGGRRMAARSLATARLMETWAHGLDCFAALGVAPVDTDRVVHVAWLGWKTLPYAFIVAGESPPAPPDQLRLEFDRLPSGARWEFGPPADAATGVVPRLGRRLVPSRHAPAPSTQHRNHGVRRRTRRSGGQGRARFL